MKKPADLCIIIATLAIISGIVSRALFRPLFGLEARAFIGFAGVMLLLAIALMMKQKLESK